MDAQARIWYKTDSIILSLHSLHRIIRLKPSTGYEEVWHVRQAPRLPAPFQQSLRPDSAPQHQTSWSSKTLQVGEIQRLQDFPISTTHAYNGRRRAGKKILSLLRHEKIRNPWIKRWIDENRQFWRRRWSFLRRRNLNHVHCAAQVQKLDHISLERIPFKWQKSHLCSR